MATMQFPQVPPVVGAPTNIIPVPHHVANFPQALIIPPQCGPSPAQQPY